MGVPGGSDDNLPAMHKIWVRSLGWDDPLQKEMATHCVILAWGNLWERVERDLVTKQQQYLDDSSCHLHCQSHSGLER